MVVMFDLDDTLFPEMEFVRSSYRTIARRYGHGLLDGMMQSGSPREAFDSTGLPVKELIEIYRTHYPDIRLPWQSLYTLSVLKNRGIRLGLITDGLSFTQRNKIRALGLDRFMDSELVFISEEIGADKLSEVAFRRTMDVCGADEKYIYVGDNPQKDFLIANRFDWVTVCLIDGTRGENIYSQDFGFFPSENCPEKCIGILTELLNFDDFRKRV